DLLCALFVSITDDEDPRLALVHDEDDLVVTEADIEGCDAHAELCRGEVGLEILCAVVRHDRHPIAFGTAEPEQGVRAPVDAGVEFQIGVPHPLEDDCGPVRVVQRDVPGNITERVHLVLALSYAQDFGSPWNCMSMLRLISFEMGENCIW